MRPLQSRPDNSAILRLLRVPGVNTLLFGHPAARSLLVNRLVASFLEAGRLVVYLDLDTAFTVGLERGFSRLSSSPDLLVATPRGEDLDRYVAQVLSAQGPVGLLVFDSVASFYHILKAPGEGFGDLNLKLGVYVALFRELAARGSTVLLTAMVKAKRGVGGWVPAPAGGEVVRRRSDTILAAELEEGVVRIRVVKHPDPGVKGQELHLSLGEDINQV